METHGARVSAALRDALLAVRELCSFALEQDSRFSSSANQRKYKVSQLYSNLLDAIRADVLRDPEHMRLVAAAATTPLSAIGRRYRSAELLTAAAGPGPLASQSWRCIHISSKVEILNFHHVGHLHDTSFMYFFGKFCL